MSNKSSECYNALQELSTGLQIDYCRNKMSSEEFIKLFPHENVTYVQYAGESESTLVRDPTVIEATVKSLNQLLSTENISPVTKRFNQLQQYFMLALAVLIELQLSSIDSPAHKAYQKHIQTFLSQLILCPATPMPNDTNERLFTQLKHALRDYIVGTQQSNFIFRMGKTTQLLSNYQDILMIIRATGSELGLLSATPVQQSKFNFWEQEHAIEFLKMNQNLSDKLSSSATSQTPHSTFSH